MRNFKEGREDIHNDPRIEADHLLLKKIWYVP